MNAKQHDTLSANCKSREHPTPPPPPDTTTIPLAPVAKGIIVLSSIIVAAGIAIYENPQVREWVLNSRKKLATALGDLADEINPEGRNARSQRRESAGAQSDIPQAAAGNSTALENMNTTVDRRAPGKSEDRKSETGTPASRISSPEPPASPPSSKETNSGRLGDWAASLELSSRSETTDGSYTSIFPNVPLGSPQMGPRITSPRFQPPQFPQGALVDVSTADEQANANVGTPETVPGYTVRDDDNFFGAIDRAAAQTDVPPAQSPPAYQDLEIISNFGGTETASTINGDDVSEIGGWSEVDPESGDEDFLMNGPQR